MLTYLDQIDGVSSSFANPSGTLIRVALRPGADPARVTEAVRRVLSERTEDLVPVQFGGGVAAAALQGEQWQDKTQIAELAATETGTAVRHTPALLLALFLAWAAVGLGLLWWRHRRKLAAERRSLEIP